jgi:hypothetical protein
MGSREGLAMGATAVLAAVVVVVAVVAVVWLKAKRAATAAPACETRDDPVFGQIRRDAAGGEPSGMWHGEFRMPDGRTLSLVVSAEVVDREDMRRLFSEVTADPAALHGRFADEHLPELNEHEWPESPMTREQFLTDFQLTGFTVGPLDVVTVGCDDIARQDRLSGLELQLVFGLDGTVTAVCGG